VSIGKQRLVLLVEDDVAIRISLTELLEGEGFQVLSEVNGQHALDLLLTLADWDDPLPNAIILDLHMPTLDGCGFLAVQARTRPELNVIPVIMISAGSNAHRTPAGVRAFVSKPIDVPTLLAILSDAAGAPKSPQSLLN
jgi:two-component system cell cycle sensor histidine kinase/response regulator CckA